MHENRKPSSALSQALSLGLLTLWMLPTVLSSPVLASIRFIPPPPPHRGEPGNRSAGGGRRSPECEGMANLLALVPRMDGQQDSIPWGLTTASHPTFWIATPVGLPAEMLLNLVVWDENNHIVHQSVQTSVATEAGSFSVSLPPVAPALQEGETYRWAISVFCDPDVPDVPIRINGYVQRIPLSAPLYQALSTTSDPLQQAILYAEAGVWYDSLTVLGNQYERTAAPAIANAWSSLLRQGNLGTDSRLPVGSCCRASDG